jgi:hypothetical protein
VCRSVTASVALRPGPVGLAHALLPPQRPQRIIPPIRHYTPAGASCDDRQRGCGIGRVNQRWPPGRGRMPAGEVGPMTARDVRPNLVPPRRRYNYDTSSLNGVALVVFSAIAVTTAAGAENGPPTTARTVSRLTRTSTPLSSTPCRGSITRCSSFFRLTRLRCSA